MKDPLHIKVSVCLKGYEVSSMPQGMLEKVQWKGMNRCLCNYHKKVQDGMMTSCGPSPLPSSPASPSTVAYVTSLVAATCYLSLLLPSAHTLASKSSFLMVVPSCHKENSTSDLSFMMDHPNICNLDQSRKTGTNVHQAFFTPWWGDHSKSPNKTNPGSWWPQSWLCPAKSRLDLLRPAGFQNCGSYIGIWRQWCTLIYFQ